MKQVRYSLWPEDPAVSRRRSQARLIAISFVAGIGFTALSPFALTYVGGWVVPTQIATPAAQVAKAHMPAAPAITAQFETLSQRLKQYAAVEHAAPPVHENAEDGASDIAAPRTTVADVPLPIPRPPDIEEVSRAMTAFVEPADRLVVPSEASTPTKLAAYAAPRPQNDPAQAKVKQVDPGASTARKPAHRITSQLASSKRDVTIYHLPDGRQLRVFGRLSNNDGDDF